MYHQIHNKKEINLTVLIVLFVYMLRQFDQLTILRK